MSIVFLLLLLVLWARGPGMARRLFYGALFAAVVVVLALLYDQFAGGRRAFAPPPEAGYVRT